MKTINTGGPMLAPNAPKTDLTQEEVQHLFRYDPETGTLFWKKPRFTKHCYKEAGYNHNGGYRQVEIKGKGYLVHRIIWLYAHGTHPEEIDHLNGERADNRLSNLRAATKSINQRNARLRCDSKSGVPGVTWCAREQRWIVRLQCEGRRLFLGQFIDFEQAKEVRLRAQKEVFGPSAGRII